MTLIKPNNRTRYTLSDCEVSVHNHKAVVENMTHNI